TAPIGLIEVCISQYSMSRCADICTFEQVQTIHGRSDANGDRPPLRNTITGGRPPGRISVPTPKGGLENNRLKFGKMLALCDFQLLEPGSNCPLAPRWRNCHNA